MMFREVFSIFFPRICAGCGVKLGVEKVLCTSCLHDLPVFTNQQIPEEKIKRHFLGSLYVENAASLLIYQKGGLTQKVLHQLKYRGDERISHFLGEWMAAVLVAQKWVREIEMVLPVPLHRHRKKKRGYNQVSGFGKALARHFQSEYSEKILVKVFDSKTQVFKSRFARTELKDAFFKLQSPYKIEGKHILLVDDIITSGATLETCIKRLLEGGPAKISVATMAITV